MDIVVKGRNVEVPEHFRQHVADKLAPSERLEPRAFRFDVELSHEKNPRQSALCQRVEITAYGKGPVTRAEACAETFYAALDAAVGKLEARLRRSADRRKVHHGAKTPPSVAEVTAALSGGAADADGPELGGPELGGSELGGSESDSAVAVLEREDDTDRLVVRDKTHTAAPMTTAQALHEMELVGHDFFLFCDSASGLPGVVYRRHGYDYGVLRLATT